MPNLYPVFDVPKVAAEGAAPAEKRQKGSFLFDFETGDFALDQAGKLIEATPYEAWQQWCLKTVYTERFAFWGYSGQVGAELTAAFQEKGKEAQESAIIKTVTEALLADPYKRTQRVFDFTFDWGTDSVDVTFYVAGVFEEGAAPITARLGKR